jgi:hypothetical protein
MRADTSQFVQDCEAPSATPVVGFAADPRLRATQEHSKARNLFAEALKKVSLLYLSLWVSPLDINRISPIEPA